MPERTYLDVMMNNLSKAQEKGGVSFAEATAVSAMIKAAWLEMRLEKFLDLVERKGTLSEDERSGVDQEVFYAMQRISKAAEAKYPLISHVIDGETSR